MKISQRLILLTAVSAAGLICVAGVSYFSVTSIQADLQGLTMKAAPLQARTLELQERTERLQSGLLRLSLARAKDEVAAIETTVAADLQEMDRLRAEIQKLEPKTGAESADFRSAQSQIQQAAQHRIADDAGYRQEAEAARVALSKAEVAIAATKQAVAQIGVDAGHSADKAQEATRRLGQHIKLSLTAQNRLKEVALVVADIDAVTNRFRLTPLRERLKAPLDSIQRLESSGAGEDPLTETRVVASKTWDLVTRDNDGLMALRAKVLTKTDGADASYQAQRKAVLALIDEQSNKLGALVDGIDVQAVKQRQTLEAALRLRNEPGGVVTTSEEVSLDIRDMVGGLRLLMLASTPALADSAQAGLRSQASKLARDMQTMRAGLQRMGRPVLVQQVDQATAALMVINGSIEKVAATKKRLLASETAMALSLAQLKAVADHQSNLGAKQVKSVAERQVEVTAAVDRRVQTSIVAVLGIAAGIIAIIAFLGVHTVRTITGRLNAAVQVAEQVAQGNLNAVPVVEGNDETTQLMAALARMVGTLREIVYNIQGAAEQIDAGSLEIDNGNRDLTQRTVQQAAQLQQTSASVEELSTNVARNAQSAQEANALATQARAVAGRGGEIVTGVVQTMTGIQDSSRRIGEIIGVIDAIAFQTNILALNAAVEAARAGEHGRGFAVVASEVRSLAGKSAAAAQQVKQIVTASVDRIDAGSKLVGDAGATMAGIVEQVNKVSELVSQISDASQVQAVSVSSVNDAVGQIDRMTQRNAALAEQGSAAALSLRTQAQSLTRAIAVFQHEPVEA